MKSSAVSGRYIQCSTTHVKIIWRGGGAVLRTVTEKLHMNSVSHSFDYLV